MTEEVRNLMNQLRNLDTWEARNMITLLGYTIKLSEVRKRHAQNIIDNKGYYK